MKLSRIKLSIIILLILHVVGVLGIGLGLRPEMAGLSWITLIVITGLMIWNRTEKGSDFYRYLSIVFALGLSIEIIGVATGYPFGSYVYGESLGWKVLNVPFVLGLNWWILVYSSIHLSAFLTKKPILRMLLAPALMLGLDSLIEPLSSQLDFWYWENSSAPLQNFLSWYLISLFFTWMYFKYFEIEKTNTVAIAAFLVQVLFFAGLNLLM